mmetsp:Transcript_80849/g.142490  ORF Transcript_80849/g.142490 Transcript_80849/m.142490 type:complete len:115 (-) Transcript_80849:865-1209(-)
MQELGRTHYFTHPYPSIPSPSLAHRVPRDLLSLAAFGTDDVDVGQQPQGLMQTTHTPCHTAPLHWLMRELCMVYSLAPNVTSGRKYSLTHAHIGVHGCNLMCVAGKFPKFSSEA